MSTAVTIVKSPNQKKKKPTKNVIPVQKAVARQRLVYKVPECAEHYFISLVNPFDTPQGVCIPCDLFPIPSLKTKTFIRGTFNLGTSGIGFVSVNPTLANNVVCTAFTTTTSVGNSAANFNTFTNTGGTMMSQLPYPSASIAATGVKGRIVAFGIRVKYIGKLMDSNGLCIGMEDPDHQDVLASQNFNSLSSNIYTSVDRIGPKEHWDKAVCCSGPVTPTELEFMWTLQPLIQTFLIIAVSGVAGDLFEYEFFQHTEFIGSPVTGKSVSHADAQAYGKIVETVKSATIDRPLEPYMAPSLWQNLKNNFVSALPSLAEGAYNVVKSATELNLPALIEGYKGLEKGFSTLYGDYGKKYEKAVLSIQDSSHHQSPSQYSRLLPEPVRVVYPSLIEVVDDVREPSPLILSSRANHNKLVQERKELELVKKSL